MHAVLLVLVSALALLAPAHAQDTLPDPIKALGNFFNRIAAPNTATAPGTTPADSTSANTRAVAAGADSTGRNLQVSPSGKRLALVIGNDNYQKVNKLQKAGNDATAMARELRAAGFEVTLQRDLNYLDMVNAIDVFTGRITGGDVVVVFFAGHGVQIKTGSYLLPTDISANSESQVEKTAYGVADLSDKLNEAKASFALVMVDACRDNPLKSNGRAIGGNRGLSAIEPPKGQMVVYSASKGQQALDKLSDTDRDPNGIFTREFIKRMKKPGVKIQDLMIEVQDSVETLAQSVSHEQRPAIYNESRGNFYFFGPTTVQVQGGQGGQGGNADPESETWSAAERANSVGGYQAYLDAYPKGRYAVAAKIGLESLKQPVQNAKPNTPATPTPAQPTARAEDPETAMWNEVKSSGAREYLDAYLKQYPKGKFITLARVELKKLDDQAATLRAQEEAVRRAQQEREIQQAALADQSSWERAKASDTDAAYSSYLQSYPSGRYAALATAAQVRMRRETSERNMNAAGLKPAPAVELKLGAIVKDCADCPELVVLSSGSFSMGGSAPKEQPEHVVTVPGFAMGTMEITQKMWIAIMGSNPLEKNKKYSVPGCTLDCPVTFVTWDEVQTYLQLLSTKTHRSYRLPSEAEWEYACRAGGKHTYCGSNNVAEVAHIYLSEWPVLKRKKPNAWGIYDMSGNVREWVQDCFVDNYTGAPNDGSPRLLNGCLHRVVRNGGADNHQDYSRAASRDHSQQGTYIYNLGFRVASDVQPLFQAK